VGLISLHIARQIATLQVNPEIIIFSVGINLNLQVNPEIFFSVGINLNTENIVICRESLN
jgi:hypothetical protein